MIDGNYYDPATGSQLEVRNLGHQLEGMFFSPEVGPFQLQGKSTMGGNDVAALSGIGERGDTTIALAISEDPSRTSLEVGYSFASPHGQVKSHQGTFQK